MSVLEKNTVDAMGVHNEGKCLALLVTDHLAWDNEYEHLKILQDKINKILFG